MVEKVYEIGMAENKEQFLEEIQEIINENPKLYKAFAKEKYD